MRVDTVYDIETALRLALRNNIKGAASDPDDPEDTAFDQGLQDGYVISLSAVLRAAFGKDLTKVEIGPNL